MVSSLRQQVHGLERALRDREGDLAELKRGVAATRLRELEVQSETYYREISRYCEITTCLHVRMCSVRGIYNILCRWGNATLPFTECKMNTPVYICIPVYISPSTITSLINILLYEHEERCHSLNQTACELCINWFSLN